MGALTDFADRMTAALEAGRGAVNDLNNDVATGAPVNQASVNTLTKVMQDLGQVAVDARRAAMDEVTPATPEPATPEPATPEPAAPEPAAPANTSTASTPASTKASTSGSSSTAKS